MYQQLAMLRPHSDIAEAAADSQDWLRLFHDGERSTIEHLYREHFETVARAVGPLLGRADKETVIHEVFLRLISQAPLRASFRGGDLGAWLSTVSRNHAIDYLRRRNRETPAGMSPTAADEAPVRSWESHAEARMLVDRFRREVLPPKWAGTFEMRFLRQLPQTEAAASLGIGRTTLAYQEARIRRLLRKFMLRGKP